MQEFEAALMDRYVAFNIAVAVAGITMSGYLAQRMRPGFLLGTLGFALATALALFVAAAATWLAAAFMTPGLAGRSWAVPLGAVAWSFATGVEFATLGISVGMLAYLVLRLRFPARQAQS
ncbi:hypothetical protein [Mesorhizobium erdmanii]|uniref:Uncharacterized protein n=1 Tax=Mesorhizobium erdmanii TaxID=1777866 RepID=A0A6M7UQW1_9HYPH|nr:MULTISPECIES: hypothetical protein [Mesorhizobium]OBQ67981.1 hypothetical protein A8146_11230 [Mesorhizobium loti]QKC79404.1 hypothetical protein EB233_31555 [Mesorhizobium erdmanii]